MTSIVDDKRLNDEELEAVAGGVTPPTIDPMLLNAMGHGFPGLSITPAATDTSTAAPTHTDASTPTVVDNTHTSVPAAAVFGGAATPAPADVPHATVTISGLAGFGAAGPAPTPEQHVTVMTFTPEEQKQASESGMKQIIPSVGSQQLPADPMAATERASREGTAFNPASYNPPTTGR